jgi:predicted lipoprotein with Yx(FWY)xxD motif
MTRRPHRIQSAVVCVVAIGAVIAAMFGAQAFGRSVAATISPASNTALGARLAVDAHGRSLYTLSPETAHHLLCTSRQCLTIWPPATVSSARAKLTLASGVAGHLGILHRRDGKFQLTLRGLPLYRFSGDHAKGQANGNAIRSFGGTWHVVSAAGGLITTPTPQPTPATPTPPPSPTTPVMTTPTYPPYSY